MQVLVLTSIYSTATDCRKQSGLNLDLVHDAYRKHSNGLNRGMKYGSRLNNVFSIYIQHMSVGVNNVVGT